MVGDILVKPSSINEIISFKEECIATCEIASDYPIYVKTNNLNEAIEISTQENSGNFEWIGLVKVLSSHINRTCKGALHQLIEPLLPLKTILIKAKEIDTPNDLKNALDWIK